jgi:hypothetical protein
MKIWLLEIGELLPLNPNNRKMRVGMLSEKFVERGHTVCWWVSAFEHQQKKMLFENDDEVTLSNGLTLQVLRGCGYRTNVSLSRYIDHRIIARKFRLLSKKMSLPDVIIALLHATDWPMKLYAMQIKTVFQLLLTSKINGLIFSLIDGQEHLFTM